MSLVSNPVDALVNANYIGILAWAVLLGIALRKAGDSTKKAISEISDALSQIVRWVIACAPFGVMGLVFSTISQQGLSSLLSYGRLILLLVGSMAFVAFVVNPIITFIGIRKNPYPLVLKCLKDSGITAFFTRSSAANIPVNMKLCEELGLDRDTYAVSIPLGSTINMGGAAVTISTLALAAVHTLGIPVDIPTAIVLCVLSAISACGASGVAGGSLLLVPLACSLFGISDDTRHAGSRRRLYRGRYPRIPVRQPSIPPPMCFTPPWQNFPDAEKKTFHNTIWQGLLRNPCQIHFQLFRIKMRNVIFLHKTDFPHTCPMKIFH